VGGLAAAWAQLPGNLRGTILILIANAILTGEAVFIRLLAETLPTAQVVFVRCVAQLVFLLPTAWRSGRAIFRTNRRGLHLARSALSLVSWQAYYYGLGHLPIAFATTLGFTNALFTTMLAGPVLGETVGWRRWAAAIVGFAGVLIVLRPGAVPIELPALAMIASALFGACIVFVTKNLAGTERTATIMLYIAIVTTLGSTIPGLASWQTPDTHGALLLAGIAVFGPSGMWFIINAIRAGEASAIAPVQYLRLVYAVALGWWVFAEWPDAWTFVGAAIIVASTLYITRREAQLARRGRAAAENAARGGAGDRR